MGQFGLKIIVTLPSQDSLTSHLAFHKQFCKNFGSLSVSTRQK